MKKKSVDETFIEQVISDTCLDDLYWEEFWDKAGSAVAFKAMCKNNPKTNFVFTLLFFGYSFIVWRDYGGWNPAVTKFNCNRRQGKQLLGLIRVQLNKRAEKNKIDVAKRLYGETTNES